MQSINQNPAQPIENLCIGNIIEVDGVTITAELEKSIKDLTRIFEGNTYYIGQSNCLQFNFEGRMNLIFESFMMFELFGEGFFFYLK